MFSLKPATFIILRILLFITVCHHSLLAAEELRVSMAYIPHVLESPDQGGFIDIIKAMDEVYDGHFTCDVFPFSRSLYNVQSGQADIHIPMIKNKVKPESFLPYAYSSEKIGDVCFVIYSHVNAPVTIALLQQAKKKKPFPLKVESILGFADYFDFPIIETPRIANSLKRINHKRIDAFIFAQEESDFIIRKNRFARIHREFYDAFDDVFVIPKGVRGKYVDHILSDCIRHLRSTGTLKPLYKKVHKPFHFWQPHEMGW